MKRLLKTARNWHYVDLHEVSKEGKCWKCGKPSNKQYDAYELDYDDTLSDIETDNYICDDCASKYDFISTEQMNQLIKELPESFDEFSKLESKMTEFDHKHMREYSSVDDEMGYEFYNSGLNMWSFDEMTPEQRKKTVEDWNNRLKEKEQQLQKNKDEEKQQEVDDKEYKSNDLYDSMNEQQQKEISRLKIKNKS